MRLQFFLICLIAASCSKPRQKQGEKLFNSYCTSCHVAPKIKDMTKELWETMVLPEMGARMGVKDSTFDPYKGHTFSEQYEIRKSAVYDRLPTISQNDWEKLKAYIIGQAPDKLPVIVESLNVKNLEQFDFRPISIDSFPGAVISFLGFEEKSKKIVLGDIDGTVTTFDYVQEDSNPIFKSQSAVTAFTSTENGDFITSVGILNPSEHKGGFLFSRQGQTIDTLASELHRPVHTLVHDFNKDGNLEIVICEFGHLTGQLVLLQKGVDGIYTKKVLMQSPGAIRTIIRDVNMDGKDDIVFLKAQGDETIMVLYQQENLTFTGEVLLRFSPLFGTSWFEMVDFDGDGDEDIITVHGDNADKTQIAKPYHGMRIHLNNGKNEFQESFFYPMYGATRSETYDYDEDGDLDIALVSTFPNYEERPVKSFVYLENTGKNGFNFMEKVLPENMDDKWFLLKAADVDADGDQDIVLSTFTYYFTPIPKDLANKWNQSKTDFMVLENTLK